MQLLGVCNLMGFADLDVNVSNEYNGTRSERRARCRLHKLDLDDLDLPDAHVLTNG